MNRSERAQPLSGLVNPATESLYLRICATGSARLGTGAGEVDPGDEATAELLDLGLAFRSGDDDRLIRPVSVATALQLLLERRQHDMLAAQRRILEGWSRLAELLPREVGGPPPSRVDGVIPLLDLNDVVTRAAELYPSAKRRMRGIETGEFPTRPTKNRVRTPPPAALRAGARFQMIYEVGYLGTPAGSEIVAESVRGGEEVRLRPRLPLKMLHVDDAVALVSLDRAANTALLVRAPALLAMLAEWFDLLWSHPTTIVPDGGGDSTLAPVQRRVLELMAVGGDDTIARRLNLSTATVRRHVKAIYTALGVDNRFAAGVAAVKRGWI